MKENKKGKNQKRGVRDGETNYEEVKLHTYTHTHTRVKVLLLKSIVKYFLSIFQQEINAAWSYKD